MPVLPEPTNLTTTGVGGRTSNGTAWGVAEEIYVAKKPSPVTGNSAEDWFAQLAEEGDAADYLIDTYAVALNELPVFTIDSWENIGEKEVDAGFGIGFWTAGNRPVAYTDVTWETSRITETGSSSKLFAIRVPSGFPTKYARFNWVRGGQSAPQPMGSGFWHPFNLTGIPEHYEVYYLATPVDEFESIAVQSGDHIDMQVAKVSYHDLLETTTEVQQGLDESLRHIHDLVDPITAEVAARGSYSPVTAGGHFRHGWANIAADGTDSSGNDHLTLSERDYVVNAGAAGARVPVVWVPIGSDPDEWRVELFRGDPLAAIVTYPESGEYWRSYDAARGDDILGHYDAYFLASENSDAPVTKTWQQDDHLRLLRGAAVEAIRVPSENLADDAVQGGLGLPATAAANRGMFIKREDAGNGFEYVAAPGGIDAITTGGGAAITGIWRGTAAQYAAISSKNANVLYVVQG